MNFANKKIASVLGALLLIAAAVGAYQFRRDSKLTSTRWTASAEGTKYDINFATGRQVVVKSLAVDAVTPTVLEGTYTSRGNHVEIHLLSLTFEGEAVVETGKGEMLDLLVTSPTAEPIKIKAVKNFLN